MEKNMNTTTTNATITTKLTREEQEVHLSYDEISRQWCAEASVAKYINKFRKAGWKEIRTLTYPNGKTAIAWFVAPDFALSIRKPEKKSISPEQRLAMKERLSSGLKSVQEGLSDQLPV